ncbi:hypothetical protein [Sphingomicrobium flavum]|nr:hypothetical protein [Sphingomicrobium flavum]
MSIAALIIALVIAFLIFRFVVGTIKFVLIAAIIVIGVLFAMGVIAI